MSSALQKSRGGRSGEDRRGSAEDRRGRSDYKKKSRGRYSTSDDDGNSAGRGGDAYEDDSDIEAIDIVEATPALGMK